MLDATASESWQHYTIRAPISACRLRHDDLKRLYELIDERRKQEANEILRALIKQANESAEAFEQRELRVRRSLVTIVSIAAPDGEAVTGNASDFFDSATIPEHIQSVLIDTANAPKAAINLTPNNRI